MNHPKQSNNLEHHPDGISCNKVADGSNDKWDNFANKQTPYVSKMDLSPRDQQFAAVTRRSTSKPTPMPAKGALDGGREDPSFNCELVGEQPPPQYCRETNSDVEFATTEDQSLALSTTTKSVNPLPSIDSSVAVALAAGHERARAWWSGDELRFNNQKPSNNHRTRFIERSTINLPTVDTKPSPDTVERNTSRAAALGSFVDSDCDQKVKAYLHPNARINKSLVQTILDDEVTNSNNGGEQKQMNSLDLRKEKNYGQGFERIVSPTINNSDSSGNCRRDTNNSKASSNRSATRADNCNPKGDTNFHFDSNNFITTTTTTTTTTTKTKSAADVEAEADPEITIQQLQPVLSNEGSRFHQINPKAINKKAIIVNSSKRQIETQSSLNEKTFLKIQNNNNNNNINCIKFLPSGENPQLKVNKQSEFYINNINTNNCDNYTEDNNFYRNQSDWNKNWIGFKTKFNKMPSSSSSSALPLPPQQTHRFHNSNNNKAYYNNFWWRIRRTCLCNSLLTCLYAMFPIFTSFDHYSFPGDFITDIVAGFTIAVLHIPQGMAYGLLAGVDPIYGLYVSFVPVLAMAFMSKSRHVSYGTFAVISMLMASASDSVKKILRHQAIASMAAEAVASSSSLTKTTSTTMSPNPHQESVITARIKREVIDPDDSSALEVIKNIMTHQTTTLTGSDLNPNQINNLNFQDTTNSLPTEPFKMNMAEQLAESFIMPSNIEILGAICIVVGVIQIIMSLMRLGVLSLMFSDQLVSSFTTASAVHVVTSQLGSLFDLNMPNVPDGLFRVCRSWWLFGDQLLKGFNQYTAILTCLSIMFLLTIKEIIEPILRRRYKWLTCLPSELVLMAVVIFSSWYWNFNESLNIHIIGMVPTGLPAMKSPRLDLCQFVLQDALTIALVSFAMNLSLGQVYAKKYRYKLNPNQELFALGSANLVASFFSCFPCASSLSRSAVQSNLNAKSQLCSIFSCVIVVSIICYFAPILHDLPRSTLSCIIIVALKGILIQITDFYENWRLSKLDAFVWVFTFLSVIASGVTYGLVLGIALSLFMIFFRLLTPNHSILGLLPGTEIYTDKNAFIDCEEISQIKIFRFNSALCYLNRTMFKSRVEQSLPFIYKQTGFASLFCSTTMRAVSTGSGDIIRSSSKQYYPNKESLDFDDKIRFLIIDCSALAYYDYSGAATLVEIIEELEEHKVTVYLAACPLKLIGMIEKMQKTSVLESNIYPTLTDAVNHAKYLRNCIMQPALTIHTGSPFGKSSTFDQSCLMSVIDVSGSDISENI